MKTKYSDDLESLSKIYLSRYDSEFEDDIFDEIEKLEREEEHVKAANLFSIYINFTASKYHSILLNYNRECVKLLIANNLVCFEKRSDEIVAISRKTQVGNQNIFNYTISEIMTDGMSVAILTADGIWK